MLFRSRKVSNFFDLEYRAVLKAVCGRDEAKLKAFAAKWGYESSETDWRKLIARDDIDLIDIACPNDMHKDIALAGGAGGARREHLAWWTQLSRAGPQERDR